MDLKNHEEKAEKMGKILWILQVELSTSYKTSLFGDGHSSSKKIPPEHSSWVLFLGCWVVELMR